MTGRFRARGANAVAFLDIEASGLGPTSYPIEIGWVGLSGVPRGRLIGPAAEWRDDEWDQTSKQVHGIEFSQIQRDGCDPWDVASELNFELGKPGLMVLSDAPGQDGFWLDRLFDQSSLKQVFELRDFNTALKLRFSALDPPFKPSVPGIRVHRAKADAECLRSIWLRAASTIPPK